VLFWKRNFFKPIYQWHKTSKGNNTRMVRLWRLVNMVYITTKTQSDFRRSHVRPLCRTFRSALHHYLVCVHSLRFHYFLPNHPPPPPMIGGDVPSMAHWWDINGQLPLWDVPARNHGICIHHLRLDISFAECNYHDSLQAHLMGGIGHSTCFYQNLGLNYRSQRFTFIGIKCSFL